MKYGVLPQGFTKVTAFRKGIEKKTLRNKSQGFLLNVAGISSLQPSPLQAYLVV
jgi:hypothetical protein